MAGVQYNREAGYVVKPFHTCHREQFISNTWRSAKTFVEGTLY